MEKFIVPRLEQIAFQVSFKEILSNLILCPDHCPKNMQLDAVAFSSRLSTCPMFSSQSLINFVRKRLEYYLVGEMNDKIRKKLVEKFNDSCIELPDNMIEPWVFLECVLDSSFLELETHASFPDSEPNLKLIQTIVKQGSLLQMLKIDFSLMKKGIEVEKVVPLITSLSPLDCLTSLDLCQLDKSHRSVLKLIGNSCPLLTHLSITGFCLSPKDILSIILGKVADDLFPESGASKKVWEEDKCLDYLLAPPELLTPICFTLRHLNADWDKKSDECWSAASFALRHLPLLEKMNGHSTSFGVELLRGNWGPGITDQDRQNSLAELMNILDNHAQLPPEARSQIAQIFSFESEKKISEEFKKACQEVVATRPRPHPLKMEESLAINRLTAAGTVSLTSLDFVPLSAWSLMVISEFCPHLKEATFGAPIVLTPRPGQSAVEDQPKLDAPHDVVTYLKKWPKLETITFVKLYSRHVIAIVEVFAPTLKQLTFVSCPNINLVYLGGCQRLESLRILKSSSLTTPVVKPSEISPSLFLPQLKSIESDICLRLWTLLLEGKPNLSHVVLNCCHIGTKGSIHRNWARLSKMWPMVETLHIRRSAGLTMPMVVNIIPQLRQLKELSLPKKITKNDPKLAARIWEDISYRSAPIRLSFIKGRSGKPCSLLPAKVEESTDSEDESVDSI